MSEQQQQQQEQQPQQQQPTTWTDSIADEALKGYAVERQWKEPAAVVESFRNLEKLVGVPKDRLLHLPEREDDAEGWGKVFARLGRPEKPEGYKLPGTEGDAGEFAKAATSWFHAAGLTQRQAQTVAEKWNEHMAAHEAKLAETLAAASEADIGKLREEWGQAYNAKVERGRRAAREFGLDVDALTKVEHAMGTGPFLKFFAAVGERLGEHEFVAGDAPQKSGPLTPAQAQARIAALRQDAEWVKKYMNGDVAAREEFERLHKMLAPAA